MKLPYLDGVRAIAALFVFASHIRMLHFGLAPRGNWLDLFLYSKLAVDVFITLSGFCLGYAALHRESTFKKFMVRRCWRILPAYYGAIAVSGLVFYFCFGYGHGIPIQAIAVNALLLADLHPRSLFYTSATFWSIGIEFRLYLVFPLFLWLYQRSGITVTILAACCGSCSWLGIVVLIAPEFSTRWYPGACFPVLFTFGLIASQSLDTKQLGNWCLGSFAALAIVLPQNLITVERGYENYLAALPFIDLLVGLLTAAMLATLGRMAISQQQHWALSLMGWQPLTALAAWSYSLYLLHYPLLRAANLFAGVLGLEGWSAIALETIPVLYCCYLFSLVFERPFLQHKTTPANFR